MKEVKSLRVTFPWRRSCLQRRLRVQIETNRVELSTRVGNWLVSSETPMIGTSTLVDLTGGMSSRLLPHHHQRPSFSPKIKVLPTTRPGPVSSPSPPPLCPTGMGSPRALSTVSPLPGSSTQTDGQSVCPFDSVSILVKFYSGDDPSVNLFYSLTPHRSPLFQPIHLPNPRKTKELLLECKLDSGLTSTPWSGHSYSPFL